jgi:hypothetical protein
MALAGDDAANQPPVANGGPDQTVGCSNPRATNVMLDGSASLDSDGDPLTFIWTGPFPKATGPTPEVSLPLGRSTVNLVVNDGHVDSKPASTTVTVVARVRGLSTALAGLVPEGLPILVPHAQLKAAGDLSLKLGLFCGQSALGARDVAAPEIAVLARNGRTLDLKSLDLAARTSKGNRNQFQFLEGVWVLDLNAKSLGPGGHVITLQMPDGRRFAANFVLT